MNTSTTNEPAARSYALEIKSFGGKTKFRIKWDGTEHYDEDGYDSPEEAYRAFFHRDPPPGHFRDIDIP